jgi:hypothetical protein
LRPGLPVRAVGAEEAGPVFGVDLVAVGVLCGLCVTSPKPALAGAGLDYRVAVSFFGPGDVPPEAVPLGNGFGFA